MSDALKDQRLETLHGTQLEELLPRIIKPTFQAGGDGRDVLVLLESLVTGVFLSLIKPGGEEEALAILSKHVLERYRASVAQAQLRFTKPAGSA